MANKFEPASRMPPYERGTSPGAFHVELGVGQAPEPARAALPQTYGIPLLELLIVDPQYVFVSWEITSPQLDLAREQLGARGFEQRRLILRLYHLNTAGELLAEQELYGETGRWFIGHQLAGKQVAAELGYSDGQSFTQLNLAGPIELPRNYLVEPTQYEELHVRYGLGSGGELVIEGLHRQELDSWPAVSLPQPSTEELAIPRELDAPAASRGMPSSPGPGLPASPWSGGIFRKHDNEADSDEEGAQ